MRQFLLDKGNTIFRSIEAASRTAMMHHTKGGYPLPTLLAEFARQGDILFLSLIDQQGEILQHAGEPAEFLSTMQEMATFASLEKPFTMLDRNRGVFILAQPFSQESVRSPHRMGRLGDSGLEEEGSLILAIGLHTQQFDQARRQDVHHTMFMGAILMLVGTAGLYSLFLYQKIRRTSSSLANMKVYTQNIIESIPVGILTLNAADRIVSCNRNTEEIFNTFLDVIKGKKLHQALPNCSISISQAYESRVGYETECTTAGGLSIPLRIDCSLLLDNEEVVIGKVLIIQDLSLFKEMEAQLERSRRMAALGKMAAGIAHEIRNPLGTLRGFAQFFGSLTAASSDSKEYSQLMISEIDRLNQTISALLQFSRPREPQRQEVSVDALFDKAVKMMAADMNSKQVELQWQKQDITLQADPDLMLQVLMNLLKNSIRATAAGGTIFLTGTEDENFVRITVSDSGCGMTPEVRERMFDPFFTTSRSGTGLGLAVSHQIVELHGGIFEVQTQKEAGTSITIRLPKK